LLVVLVSSGAVQAQMSVLYSFDRQFRNLSEGVVIFADELYGTTLGGGAHNSGILWSVDVRDGSLSQVHDFDPSVDGRGGGGLAAMGTQVIGTAPAFFRNDVGTLWAYDSETDTFSTLYEFDSDVHGIGSLGPLAVREANVYGTTVFEDSDTALLHGGTIWSFDMATDTYTKLHDFHGEDDGEVPGCVVMDGDMLFGMAGQGGANGTGTIWSFDTTTNTFTKLHDFAPTPGAKSINSPGSCIAVSDAILFGTTRLGGALVRGGTLWSFDMQDNSFEILHNFGTDGFPHGPGPNDIILSENTLFGATSQGGADDDGTLWSFDVSTDTFVKLHDFRRDLAGSLPIGSLAMANNQVFGTTALGGLDGGGTLWSFAVPEPSAITLSALGFLGLIGFRRKRIS
jgi:uncharacterized repeat protein (TIGR03803 family)